MHGARNRRGAGRTKETARAVAEKRFKRSRKAEWRQKLSSPSTDGAMEGSESKE
jgi:hypothetical protein